MAGRTPAFSIQLAVSDIGTTEAFYAGILEVAVERALTVTGAPEHLVVRQSGCNVIFVDESDVVRAHPVLDERLGSYVKGVGMTLHFTVEDIDGIYDAVMEEGMEILYPLQVTPYGTKELWVFDPDGYLLVLEEKAAR